MYKRQVGSGDNRYYHLVLLAENDLGYHNLMKIVSRGFTEGYYYKPRVDTVSYTHLGELLLFCFYESLDGKTDWIEQTIPYEGRIECYGVQDNMYHQIYPELTDVNIDVRMDEDGEMRLIGVEATLEVRLIIYEEEQVDILSDIYSLEQACTPRVDVYKRQASLCASLYS